ncbi:MAG: ATP phosphoribosyltransferase [candidate division WOR-3 bacterium]
MFTIAIPKGRLQDEALSFLRERGFPINSNWERDLIQVANGYRFILAKPTDVAVLVQEGLAQAGITGTDILEETAPEVIRLKRLGFGFCRLALAGPEVLPQRPWTVATRYPNLAARFLGSRDRIIILNGAVELAPRLGLAHAIVDLVATGKTLEANGLRVIEFFLDCEAELIANPASLSFGWEEYYEMAQL